MVNKINFAYYYRTLCIFKYYFEEVSATKSFVCVPLNCKPSSTYNPKIAINPVVKSFHSQQASYIQI